MKLLISALIALSLKQTPSAHAQDLTTANAPAVTSLAEADILGASIVSKKSGQALALTCRRFAETAASEICETIQFIYFDGQKSQYVGPEYELRSPVSTQTLVQNELTSQSLSPLSLEQEKIAVKRVLENAFAKAKEHYRQTKKTKRDENWPKRLAIGVGGAAIATPVMLSAAPAVGAGLFVLVAINLFRNADHAKRIDFNLGKINSNFYTEHVLLNQNGWNWQMKQKKVSEDLFMSMLIAVL